MSYKQSVSLSSRHLARLTKCRTFFSSCNVNFKRNLHSGNLNEIKGKRSLLGSVNADLGRLIGGLLGPSKRQAVRNFSSSSSSCKSFADDVDSDRVLTSKELRKVLKKYVGTKHFDESDKVEKSQQGKMVQSQDELEPRSMKDSTKEAIIPLGNDPIVRDKYLTFYKTVRIGKLLEDMDTLAGLVGYKYYKGPSSSKKAPFALVTGSVDKFNIMESNIRSDRNIKMTGFVSWAGKTSLEITIHIGKKSYPFTQLPQ